MDKFAEKLKAAMDKARMRQVDLVAKSGLSKGMVSMYVSGACEPTSESLEKLALALGVTMEYFTGGAPLAEKPLPKRLKRISPRMAAQVLGTGTRYIEDGLKSILEESRGLVNQTAADVQTLIYRAAGINLNPVAPVPNKWRLDDLINKLAGAEKFEDVAWALDAPVKNMAQSFADDYIRENVTFQVRAGLQPTVTRTAAAGCCEWCAAKAGVYEFDDAFNEGIYRRHERCRCVVTATVRRGDGWGRQNVWTKKWMDPDEAANIERRKTVGLE